MANYKRIFIDNHQYFFTVVCYQRNPILIDNIQLLKQSFKKTKQVFQFKIEAIIVLPDHFHMILNIKNSNDYPKIISYIKRHFSKNCHPKYYNHLNQSLSRLKQNYFPVWQKRFYEHMIRDENDLKNKMDYIHYNPVKHGLVISAIEWKHSSFHKFIRLGYYESNWCDFDSKIDFE